MAPETVTVTIRSSVGEDAPLTVDDAMRQILDFFQLLEAAGGEEAALIAWQLVEISINSPLHATARAVAKVPGIDVAPIARREKNALAHSIEDMVLHAEVPDWMDDATRARAKSLFARNTNGIGRTDIQFYEDTPLTIIDQRTARAAVTAIDQAEKVRTVPRQDLSRIEMGSVEGDVLVTGPYRGQPAIQIRERLSGSEIWCVFSPELAETAGPQHSWAETWTNRRVFVTGQITFSRDGRIRHVYALGMEDVDPKPLTYKDIADPNFTGGLGVSEYISSLWEEEVG